MSHHLDSPFAPYAATLLRLSLAGMWISHALLKLMVFTIPGFQQFLAAHGMPAFIAWPVVGMELAGGVLILIGFHGRAASMLLLPILAGAIAAHLGNGWVFSNPNGGWEYPLFLILMSLVHVMLGDGVFAIIPRTVAPALRPIAA
ncbi:MAG: DoxX family protein [Massilia sp.]